MWPLLFKLSGQFWVTTSSSFTLYLVVLKTTDIIHTAPMRFHLLLILQLGGLGLAQTVQNSACECPQVSCITSDPMHPLRHCVDVSTSGNCFVNDNSAQDTFLPSLEKPCLQPPPTPKPSAVATPLPCVCEEVLCTQQWPESCFCENKVAQDCYAKCGGPQPTLQTCPASALPAREAEPAVELDPVPVSDSTGNCTCEDIMCIQVWPDSCWCANAAAERCYDKCGGEKPQLMSCPPQEEPSTLTTLIQEPSSTPTPPPQPINTHKICGGGRASTLSCDPGETCITDPYTPGCGPACDALGICVRDKMCGGFAGWPCDEPGQLCLDDPRDDCDPMTGGADCAGLCVWPHKSLHADG
ncbi:hypothetical protein J1614_007817 [Plenodomus biglobosus]|nr:hypothetical protein J1614_007817 [Plenodomus biglobosus]